VPTRAAVLLPEFLHQLTRRKSHLRRDFGKIVFSFALVFPMTLAPRFMGASGCVEAQRQPQRSRDMQIRTVAAMALVGGVVASHANGQAVEWRVEDGGNGHWYEVRVVPTGTTWVACRDEAQQLGGSLACITSQEEHDFVYSAAQKTDGAWHSGFGPALGGFQSSVGGPATESWTWVSGEPWKFEAWAFGEPNDHADCGPGGDEKYLAFLSDGWNDIQDETTCSFGWLVPSYLIEYSADCNNDGIVDYGQILTGALGDTNANNIPDCCEGGSVCLRCVDADVIETGVIDAVDLAAVISAWGTDGGKYPRADIDGSGEVDAADLTAILTYWGPCSE
jgi:hypothetical protein